MLLVVFVVVAPMTELLLDRIGQLSLVRRTILRKDYIEGTWASVIRPTTVDPHTNARVPATTVSIFTIEVSDGEPVVNGETFDCTTRAPLPIGSWRSISCPVRSR